MSWLVNFEDQQFFSVWWLHTNYNCSYIAPEQVFKGQSGNAREAILSIHRTIKGFKSCHFLFYIGLQCSFKQKRNIHLAGWVRVAVSFWFHVNLSSAATGYSITLTYKPEGQQSFDLTIGKLASSKSTFPKMLNCGFEIIAVLKAAVVLANGCLFSFSYPIIQKPSWGSGQDVLQDRDAPNWIWSRYSCDCEPVQ